MFKWPCIFFCPTDLFFFYQWFLAHLFQAGSQRKKVLMDNLLHKDHMDSVRQNKSKYTRVKDHDKEKLKSSNTQGHTEQRQVCKKTIIYCSCTCPGNWWSVRDNTIIVNEFICFVVCQSTKVEYRCVVGWKILLSALNVSKYFTHLLKHPRGQNPLQRSTNEINPYKNMISLHW